MTVYLDEFENFYERAERRGIEKFKFLARKYDVGIGLPVKRPDRRLKLFGVSRIDHAAEREREGRIGE